MIPRKIGESPDRRGFNTAQRVFSMAESKTAGAKKAAKTKAAPKATAAKKAAPKKTKPAAKSAKKTAPKAPKKATPKKAAGPKLSPTQHGLLERISTSTGPYLAEKKPDQKVVDSLLKHKLVKKGKKDEKTKFFHVEISLAGKKFLGTKPAPAPKA
jgi:hypothetical protein